MGRAMKLRWGENQDSGNGTDEKWLKQKTLQGGRRMDLAASPIKWIPDSCSVLTSPGSRRSLGPGCYLPAKVFQNEDSVSTTTTSGRERAEVT